MFVYFPKVKNLQAPVMRQTNTLCSYLTLHFVILYVIAGKQLSF